MEVMLFRSVSLRTARLLAGLFALTTFLLAAFLAGSWLYVYRYVSQEGTPPPPPLLQTLRPLAGTVSPLQVNYKLELPGRGEIFPALTAGSPADYWPVAILTISNASDRPVAQTVSARVAPGNLSAGLGAGRALAEENPAQPGADGGRGRRARTAHLSHSFCGAAGQRGSQYSR